MCIPVPQSHSPEHVREVLDEVLAGVDFQDRESPLMQAVLEIFEWFFGLFEDLGLQPSQGSFERGIELVWLAVLVLAAVFAVALLWRTVRAVRARRPNLTASGAEDLALRVDQLRQEAARAEQAGDFTLALRLHFFALVIGLGQRGELQYNAAWTNRELLERGQPRPAVAQLLRPLVGELDAHSFGEEPTGASEVRHFAEVCERLLGGQAA